MMGKLLENTKDRLIVISPAAISLDSRILNAQPLISKEKYKKLCTVNSSISLYSKDWWLDAVCGDNWDVLILELDGKIVATWPIYQKKMLGLSAITQPPMAPNLGIWIDYPEGMSEINKLSFEIYICNQFIKLLPRYSKFSVSFDLGFQTWIPFYWQGFRQTSKYAYVLEGISDWQKVLANFSKETHGRIRKAKKNIQIKYDLSAEEFYKYHEYILKKIDKKINYSFDLFKRIHDAALTHNCGKISYAVDENGLIHCASFLVWDCNCAYALLGAFDRDCNPSGASFLLYQEEIKYASQFVDSYNLGCTMNKTLSYAKRRLGANLVAYHHIINVKSKLIKIATFLTHDFWD